MCLQLLVHCDIVTWHILQELYELPPTPVHAERLHWLNEIKSFITRTPSHSIWDMQALRAEAEADILAEEAVVR